MSLKELIQRQKEILENAKNDGNRALTDAEKAEFDSLQAEIESIRAQNQRDDGDDINGNQRVLEEERRRASEITMLCRAFDMDAGEYIANGSTVDDVRKLILEKQMNERAPQPVGIQFGKDEREKFRDAKSDRSHVVL